ncbi:MAG: hypothetical protein AB7S26_13550 [Sandaracinaceae bacterium]
MTWIGRALSAIAAAPDALLRVDAAVGEGASAPDLAEHSFALIDERLRIARATYYYDGERGAYVGASVASLATELGVAAPDELARPLEDACVLQHVIGIDAGPPLRLKRYMVFRAPPGAYVASRLEALGVSAPDGLDLDDAVILGVDLGAGGVHDVKIYVQLDPERTAAYVRRDPTLRAVLRETREVVLGQRLLKKAPRTLYFHADGPRALRTFLSERAERDPGAAAALAHLRALDARHPIDPWILGVPFTERGVDPRGMQVYVHPRE